MKAIARIGATLSFTFFLLAGGILLSYAKGPDDVLALVLGFFTLGLAFFLGPMLWLAGEKCSSKNDH